MSEGDKAEHVLGTPPRPLDMDVKGASSRSSHPFLTVGHSNLPMEHFLDLLRRNAIQVVADSRSYPVSRHAPHFSKEHLEAALAEAGLGYVYLGEVIGGRPRSMEFYDEGGHVLYWKVARTAPFLHGIERLETWRRRYCVAILCTEENPGSCHRRLLVGRVLGERGWKVLHIRGDGTAESEEDIAKREPPRQLNLGIAQEDPEWKSTRSVLQRRAPESFSTR